MARRLGRRELLAGLGIGVVAALGTVVGEERRIAPAKTGHAPRSHGDHVHAEASPGAAAAAAPRRVVAEEVAREDAAATPAMQRVNESTGAIAPKPELSYAQLKTITEPLSVIETDAPLVAITIDDGFDKEAIKSILSIAKGKGITYTDFMKGLQRRDYPDMVQAMIGSGIVEFGNHTETHRDQRNAPVPGRRPTWDEFKADIMLAEQYLNTFGQTSRPYLRPPGGSYDKFTVEWDVQLGFLPLNWFAAIETIPVNVPRGAIILAHYRQSSVQVFEQWIDAMLQRGLRPTAVSNVIAHANQDFWKRFGQG